MLLLVLCSCECANVLTFVLCVVTYWPLGRQTLPRPSLLSPEKFIVVEHILTAVLVNVSAILGLSPPGMKRKVKAMGTIQSSNSATKKRFTSDTLPSSSLPQGDVSVQKTLHRTESITVNNNHWKFNHVWHR